MGGGEGGRVTVRFPILGPLGISFGAPDGAQRPVISAISPTGLAAEVPGLRPGARECNNVYSPVVVSIRGSSLSHSLLVRILLCRLIPFTDR